MVGLIVSNTDRVGKRYCNMASVFTIGDEEEGMFGVWSRWHGYLIGNRGQLKTLNYQR